MLQPPAAPLAARRVATMSRKLHTSNAGLHNHARLYKPIELTLFVFSGDGSMYIFDPTSLLSRADPKGGEGGVRDVEKALFHENAINALKLMIVVCKNAQGRL